MINHDYCDDFTPMTMERLNQLHDDWVFTRPVSTQSFGEMLDEIKRLKETVKKLQKDF